MNYLILFVKGLIIGIGKVIPGVSGSILAISLNVYEKAIDAICNLFSNFRNSFTYLFFLGLGIIISIIFGSKIMLIFLSKYFFITFSIIIGLIIGTIPKYINNIGDFEYKKIFYFIIPFMFIFFFSVFKINLLVSVSSITYFIIGLIEAITTIIPGVSSTAIYMSLNIYNLFLNVISNPFNSHFLLFLIGLAIGVLITSKIINYLFKKYKTETHMVILSFLLSTIIVLIKNIFLVKEFNFILFLIFLSVGFVISHLLNK